MRIVKAAAAMSKSKRIPAAYANLAPLGGKGRTSRWTALFAGLLLAGCASVGPDYHRPVEKPLALQGADAAQNFQAKSFQASWWQQFNDPTLDTLIQRAAKNSPDLKIALARLKEARALLGTARADQIPTIDADANFTRSRGQVPGVTDKRVTSKTYQAGFDASWELDLFGGIRRSVEAAGAEAAASEASLQDAQVTLFAEVARYYFDLRGTQLRIEVANRDIDNQRESMRLIRARMDIG
ncbi:TolC family protein, partial [Dyella silvatica]|uniref:TolC family protein n=1 Tax=Dyella silvatica TaxID=2992128 RepID=UPI00224CE63C